MVSTRSGARARHERLMTAAELTPRRSQRLLKAGSHEEQTPRKLQFEDDDDSQPSQTTTETPFVSSQEDPSVVSSQEEASVNEEEKVDKEPFEENEENFEKGEDSLANVHHFEEKEEQVIVVEEEQPIDAKITTIIDEIDLSCDEEITTVIDEVVLSSDEDIFDDEAHAETDDDAPLEVTSKKIVDDVENNTEQKTTFEMIQEKKREVESDKVKKAETRRLKRKKVSVDTFSVKTKKTEFTVVQLDKKMTTKLEPSTNFRAELLKNRTAGRRFQNGAANWTHRTKWAGNRL